MVMFDILCFDCGDGCVPLAFVMALCLGCYLFFGGSWFACLMVSVNFLAFSLPLSISYAIALTF